MMSWFMFNFQNSNNMMMFNLNKFNNIILIIMIMIIITILYLMFFLMYFNKINNKSLFENNNLEFMWTIFPMILIIMMILFSIKTLYMNNEMKLSSINIKIMSNQWFWFYEYMNFNIKFNSYMIYNKNWNFYLIETNNHMIIPMNYQINIIVSSLDVIHSWTIPSLNIKIDSIPNQINNMNLISNKMGLMFGQCSEICGMNHSFMPIQIESINIKNFIKWINNY